MFLISTCKSSEDEKVSGYKSIVEETSAAEGWKVKIDRVRMQNADFGNLTPTQRDSVMNKLDELQMQDSMNTFNGLVQRCFDECVVSFRSKDLDKSERECVQNCVDKFMKFSQRIGQRFAERNQQQQPPS